MRQLRARKRKSTTRCRQKRNESSRISKHAAGVSQPVRSNPGKTAPEHAQMRVHARMQIHRRARGPVRPQEQRASTVVFAERRRLFRLRKADPPPPLLGQRRRHSSPAHTARREHSARPVCLLAAEVERSGAARRDAITHACATFLETKNEQNVSIISEERAVLGWAK